MSNETVGQVLDQIAFDSEKSRSQALQAARRFERFIYINSTRSYEIEICLFQGYDTTPPIPRGYVDRTGVTVGGVNIRPGTRRTTLIQPGVKCLANKVGCSVNVKHIGTGKVTEYHHPDKFAPSGKYFTTCAFGISQQSNQSGELTDTLDETFVAESVDRA